MTVVVESAETGGVLITASLALDYDQSVFAVPGDVDRATLRGCNLLIRKEPIRCSTRTTSRPELELVLGPVGSQGF